MARKFYRRVIQVEVLSEEPLGDIDLEQLHQAITDGPCSGYVKTVKQETVNGKKMVRLLEKQGSDPEFFGLDSNGRSIR